MNDLSVWEWSLLVGGAFLAVVTLLRLMRSRRESILQELRVRAEWEQRRQQAEQQAEQRRKRNEGRGGKAA